MTTVLQKNLYRQLKKKNISAHALEKQTGLKASAIQNILQGKSKKPSADLIFTIAQELECSVEDLLQNEPSSDQSAPASAKKWVLSLYMDALKTVHSLLEGKNLELAKDQVLKLVEEVYLYSLEGNLSQADQRFAGWLISRHFQKS